jgi:L-seryl-tRNA(Ser) seleniumtransferase
VNGYHRPVSGPNDASAEARKIPKVDRLLAAADRAGLVGRLGHAPVLETIRASLDDLRRDVLGGAPCPPPDEVEARVLDRLSAGGRTSLRHVVNATGVVIHTNLGRAPLSRSAVAAMAEAAAYANLEYDLDAGERGDRYGHAAAALARLSGAEAALAVNNCASAVLLALSALSEGLPERWRQVPGAVPDAGAVGPGGRPEVMVSRSQLVEIGGGFRVPDVLRRSGADLVEVGTTNRTYLRDFEAAVSPRTRIALSVHRSNFRLEGFVHDTRLEELVGLGRADGIWVVEDLGSGALFPTAPFGLGDEPTVASRVATGADVVCFSGDKLLGGPQAGLLVGRREAIDRCRRHPLLRALRLDKVALAGLAATLAHYERGEAVSEVPVWRAIARTPDELRARAEAWRESLALPGAEVVASTSAVGGGTLPGVTLPTFVLALPTGSPDAVAARLRGADVPVVARIEDGRVVLDPRTVLPGEDDAVVAAIRLAVGGGARG